MRLFTKIISIGLTVGLILAAIVIAAYYFIMSPEYNVSTSVWVYYSAVAFIIISIFIGVTSYVLSLSLSRPLDNLQEYISEINQGNLSIELKGKSNIEEINYLYGSLEKVIASLKLAILKTGVTKGELGLGEVLREKRFAEKRAEEFFDISSVMMIVIDDKGNISRLNKKGAEMLGYKDFRELIGKSWFENFVPEEDRARTKAVFDQIVKGKISSLEYYENQIIDKLGKKRLIAWHNSILRDSDGRIIGTLSSGEDITERRKAEGEIKESAERFKILFDSSPEAYYLIDSMGRFIDINKTAEKLMGYSKKEVIGKSIIKIGILSLKDVPRAVALLAKNAAGKPGGPDEFNAVRKDGSTVDVELLTQPIILNEKRVILGIARDISERKKGEAESIKLASIAKYSNELINLSTLDGRMVFLNEKGQDMLGIREGNVHKHNILDVIPSDLKDKVKNEVVKSILTKGEWSGELQYKNVKTGKLIDVYASTFAIKDSISGKPLYLANNSVDITEKKRAGEEVRVSEEKFRSMVASSPMGMHLYSLDENGRLILTDTNPAASKILNTDCNKLVGKTIEEAFPGLKGTKIPKDYMNVIKNGKMMFIPKVEYHYGKINGFYDVYAFKTSKNSMVASFLDITERVKEGEAVKESEERYASTVSVAGVLVYDYDIKSGKIVWSGNIKEITGFSEDEFGKNIRDWEKSIHPDDRASALKELDGAMRAHRKYSVEYRIKIKDSTYLWVSDFGRFLYDSKGKAYRMLGIMRDITEKKRAEEKLMTIEAVRNIQIGREKVFRERESVSQEREGVVGRRENVVIGRERMVGRREKIKVGKGREGIALGREKVVGKREDVAKGREKVVGKREEVETKREKAD